MVLYTFPPQEEQKAVWAETCFFRLNQLHHQLRNRQNSASCLKTAAGKYIGEPVPETTSNQRARTPNEMVKKKRRRAPYLTLIYLPCSVIFSLYFFSSYSAKPTKSLQSKLHTCHLQVSPLYQLLLIVRLHTGGRGN